MRTTPLKVKKSDIPKKANPPAKSERPFTPNGEKDWSVACASRMLKAATKRSPVSEGRKKHGDVFDSSSGILGMVAVVIGI
jgi:hypothetical protein